MSSLLRLSLTPTADHSEKLGYFVKASSGNAALVSATTDTVLGVIVDGATTSNKDTVQLLGDPTEVLVRLGSTPGTIAKGSYLQLESDGTVILDAGSGARQIVARALETATTGNGAGGLIRASLVERGPVGAAVTLGSTNGTAAGAADLAALKAEAELIGDDVRALHASLRTRGLV